jgi:hypothetical protein
MKRIIALSLLLLVLGSSHDVAGEAALGKGVSKLMAEKLKNSQKLLEGIAVGDFTKVTSSAEELIQLSRNEEWLMLKTPRYEVHSNEFRRACETLIQKAKDKNIDGTTLAFFDMTMSCVRCHQYVREVRDARLPGSPQPVASLAARRGNVTP